MGLQKFTEDVVMYLGVKVVLELFLKFGIVRLFTLNISVDRSEIVIIVG